MDSLAHILHYEFIKPIKGAISGYPTMFSLSKMQIFFQLVFILVDLKHAVQ